MVNAAFPAEAHADGIEQLAGHFMRKARKGNAVLIVVLSVLFGGGGYFALQAAVAQHTTELEGLGGDVKAHQAKPAHRGGVSHEQLEKVQQQVTEIDRAVVKIGETLDGEARLQQERHDDLKEELRYLRRRRNRDR